MTPTTSAAVAMEQTAAATTKAVVALNPRMPEAALGSGAPVLAG